MKRTNTFYFLFCSVLLLSACGSWQVTSVEPRYYTLDTLTADTAMNAMIAPYKASIDSVMNEVLTELPFDLQKGKPNGNLGFWMADALRNQAGLKRGAAVDIALINQGGIRRPYLNAGPVTIGMMYELMPFDNYLVVLQVNGDLLYRMLKKACERGGDPVSGARILVKKDTLEITINGEALKGQQNYLVATNDYMFEGGDGYTLMQEATQAEHYVLVRTALIDEMKNPFKAPFPTTYERRIRYE